MLEAEIGSNKEENIFDLSNNDDDVSHTGLKRTKVMILTLGDRLEADQMPTT